MQQWRNLGIARTVVIRVLLIQIPNNMFIRIELYKELSSAQNKTGISVVTVQAFAVPTLH